MNKDTKIAIEQHQGTTGSRRRRSSGPAYEGLLNYKRSTDPSSIARRASLYEQKPPSGFFGSLWYNFTRGPAGSPAK
ncbi:hypothetical protein GGR50DRAFT_649316 [Xylaria sp. CBS 124048]|nr:hypothetical protein GGR50DRAFT_649316 [Xylaria sp. CBS 124048]